MKIEIEGKKYEVVENLGYNHSAGAQAKIILDGESERTVVKQGGAWRFWTARDRLGL